MTDRSDPVAVALGLAPPQPLPPFPKSRGAAPVLSDGLRAVGIALRPATAADLPFLIELYLTIRAREFLLAPWTRAEREALMRDQFALQHRQLLADHPKADYWIIERNGTSIGRYYLDRSLPLWRAMDMGFLPDARSQGYGRAILEWTKAEITRTGAQGLNFSVAIDNHRARALYERIDFQVVGDVVMHHHTMEWRANGL